MRQQNFLFYRKQWDDWMDILKKGRKEGMDEFKSMHGIRVWMQHVCMDGWEG